MLQPACCAVLSQARKLVKRYFAAQRPYSINTQAAISCRSQRAEQHASPSAKMTTSTVTAANSCCSAAPTQARKLAKHYCAAQCHYSNTTSKGVCSR
jgi:hypothetical protein